MPRSQKPRVEGLRVSRHHKRSSGSHQVTQAWLVHAGRCPHVGRWSCQVVMMMLLLLSRQRCRVRRC